MLTKLGLYVCGSCCAAYCGYAAYRFNAAQASGVDGYVFAGVMAALAAGNWLLISSAVKKWRDGKKRSAVRSGAVWSIILTVVLLNSAGFTVGNRREAVTDRATEIAAHERAQQAFDDAKVALAQAHSDVLWKDTAACADVTTRVRRAFCSRVDRLEADQKRLDAELRQAPPGAADASADLLSKLTGLKVEVAGSVQSVATAVVLEIAANFLLVEAEELAWPTWPKTVEPEAAPKVEPALAPEKPKRRRVKRRATEGRRKPVKSPPALRIIPGDRI